MHKAFFFFRIYSALLFKVRAVPSKLFKNFLERKSELSPKHKVTPCYWARKLSTSFIPILENLLYFWNKILRFITFHLELKNSCGQSKLRQTRVINGVDARPGQWPWIASLQLYETHYCGATLISPNWVMSCFFTVT